MISDTTFEVMKQNNILMEKIKKISRPYIEERQEWIDKELDLQLNDLIKVCMSLSEKNPVIFYSILDAALFKLNFKLDSAFNHIKDIDI